jgi:probable aminopeptidase NPEPL1
VALGRISSSFVRSIFCCEFNFFVCLLTYAYILLHTGGLSLKSKEGMCGMKHDMGGSAAMLGGFYACVKAQIPKKITLLLCLAENAIGPTAFRNDDILTMYSGKTVEINNCDAEGRLVLGDGVAHATKHIADLDLVVDMGTLTGAQQITTGKKHAGILANTVELEQQAVAAGLYSGDLVFPMLYAPELLMKEFDSKVADMKNSVKDRSNAQSSCAGHFIEAHLDEKYQGGWLHVDIAGPASKDERGTGYGVGFILALLEAPGF